MKNIARGVLVLALSLALAACSGGGNNNDGGAAGNAGDSGNTASSWPTGTVNLTVAYNAGGGTDLAARAFAEVAPQFFNGQAFTVSNVSGGGGATWYAQGANKSADGYETTIATVEIVTLPLLQNVPFSSDDYTYIARMNFPAAAMTVRSDSPYETLDDLLDAARENPGQIRVGNSGVNAIWDLHTYALEQATGVVFNHIPYDGAAPAVTALLSQEIDAVAVSAAEVSTQVLDGDFKILAVANSGRLESFPDAVTYDELNMDMPYIGGWRGLAVPKGTPDDVVAAYREAAGKTINSDDFKVLMERQSLTVDYLDGEGFQNYISDQKEFFTNLISELGLSE